MILDYISIMISFALCKVYSCLTYILFCSVTRTIVEKYWKTGALYELSRDAKKTLGLEDSSKVNYLKIMEKHYKVLDPIMNYW